jgi:ATP-binding cassette subfamily B protein
MRRISGTLTSIQDFRAAAGRYLETLSIDPESDGLGSATLPSPVTEISFEGAAFAYSEQGARLAIPDVTLRRPQVVAVVGLSGSGKTALVDILLGIERLGSGAFRIGGSSLEDFSLAEWRARLGVVLQDPAVFGGTLRRNLSLLKPNASDEILWELLEKAHLADTVRARGGLDTRMLEDGSNWSGGEIQRIALLRVLLADPELALLDEPTSSLDALVEEAMWDLLRGGERITVIITHRMALAAKADTVMVIGGSDTQSIGPPGRLYEANALFRSMCLAQQVRPEAGA